MHRTAETAAGAPRAKESGVFRLPIFRSSDLPIWRSEEEATANARLHVPRAHDEQREREADVHVGRRAEDPLRAASFDSYSPLLKRRSYSYHKINLRAVRLVVQPPRDGRPEELVVDERAWGEVSSVHVCVAASKPSAAAAARSPLEGGVRASLRKVTPRKEPAASGTGMSGSFPRRSIGIPTTTRLGGRTRRAGPRRWTPRASRRPRGTNDGSGDTGGRDPADETRAASQRAAGVVGASLKPRRSSLGARAHSERAPRRAERGRKPMGLGGLPSSEPRRGTTTVAAPRAIDRSLARRGSSIGRLEASAPMAPRDIARASRLSRRLTSFLAWSRKPDQYITLHHINHLIPFHSHPIPLRCVNIYITLTFNF